MCSCFQAWSAPNGFQLWVSKPNTLYCLNILLTSMLYERDCNVLFSKIPQTWGFLRVKTHYQLVLLCHMFTFAKIMPASFSASDRGSMIYAPTTLCVIYAHKEEGVALNVLSVMLPANQ